MYAFLILFSCSSAYEENMVFSVNKPPSSNDSPAASYDSSSTDTYVENVDSGVEQNTETICGDQQTGVTIGLCAQDFSLPDADQVMISLHEHYGQVIFIDFSSFT